ncbi:LytTR family DNA-binding domain-containing protein [Streptococcus panodentis]|uniref:LytTR family transcriptional regulator n=1 Tax=Streptococcus panodentis TaxID=1581472 RepID=A0ABS5AZP9_9STRE|nr:LytTR family DNA-binding domain-containing protein [Streptococcus panodentis]MBP2622052.1 LytTR family transcriptional regulator [Streptococcus panodentis]
MKVNLRIDPQTTEDSVSIEARHMTENIQKLVRFSQNLGKQDQLHVKREDQIYLLNTEEIYRIYTENRQIQVRTADGSYRSQQPLYQLLETLPEYFLQISQSEIINSRQISHLRLTPNGLIQIFLKNGVQTYSSRRYLKSIKERLQL